MNHVSSATASAAAAADGTLQDFPKSLGKTAGNNAGRRRFWLS
ncbi:MAG TPA: hypothetical protein VND95_13025 [Stellaceae bacterium]|nr:hypothetical protein [Stellaceae bacterium]